MAARVLLIQHTHVCPPGRVGSWLTSAGCTLDVVAPYAGERLPSDLTGVDGLVVLGGEMGAYDDAEHPWLTPTKELLRAAVASGLPTLAVCLGHQLLAVATGGVVERSRAGQLGGARPVVLTEAAVDDPLFAALGPGRPAVHWNNDLVTVPPPDAVVLAQTPNAVQVMRVGPAAWGVQFHPEADPATVRLWADADVAGGHLPAPTARRWLAEVEAADQEMVTAWGALTGRFADLVTDLTGSGPSERTGH